MGWATHVVKMDMDAFPWIGSLTKFLYEGKGCRDPYEFFGHQADMQPTRKLHDLAKTTKHCELPSCHQNFTNTTKLAFMQGGLYGMSRKLALGVTGKRGTWARHRSGFEDQT